jgi:hypothetical protein
VVLGSPLLWEWNRNIEGESFPEGGFSGACKVVVNIEPGGYDDAWRLDLEKDSDPYPRYLVRERGERMYEGLDPRD